MKQNSNRVLSAMQEWLQQEKSMSELFSPKVVQSRHFQLVKLSYLRGMEATIGPSANKDEKMTLRILRGERRNLERNLYRSPLVRTAVQVVRAISRVSSFRRRQPAYEQTKWIIKNTNTPPAVARPELNAVKKMTERKLNPRPEPKLMQKKTNTPGYGMKI